MHNVRKNITTLSHKTKQKVEIKNIIISKMSTKGQEIVTGHCSRRSRLWLAVDNVSVHNIRHQIKLGLLLGTGNL